MPVSAKSLHARGLISDKQMKLAALKGSRSQPSKMAPFNGRGRTAQGSVGDRGTLTTTNQINSNATQRTGGKFLPSKGGSVGKGGGLTKNQISEGAAQRPKFPAGHKMRGKLTKPKALKGTTSQSSGVVYDTPDRNSPNRVAR